MKEDSFSALPILGLPKAPSIVGLALLSLIIFSLPAFAQERLIPIAAWSFNRCSQDLSDGHILDGSGRRIDKTEGKPNHLMANDASCANRVGLNGRFGDAGWFTAGTPAESRVAVPLGDRFTVSAWVNPIPFAGDLGVVSGGGGSYALVYSRALNGGRGGFRFVYAGVSIDSRRASPGEWHHVAAVLGPDERCEGQARLRVYVDEVPEPGPPVCAPTRNLEETVVVGDGFRGRVDEVTLYLTRMNQAQISGLFGRPKPVYLGADTNAHPEAEENGDYSDYPKNARGERNPLGYDFYLGRMAVGITPCPLKTFSGHDIVTGEQVQNPSGCPRTDFQMYAAAIARPQRTYGYVLLHGPNHRPGEVADSRAYGAAQAATLANQRSRYLHVVYGRTLFADIEDLLNSGWDTGCGRGIASACERNQEVLEGFLDRATRSGSTAGVYTRLDVWNEAFGTDYFPPTEFVAWITGWHTSKDNSGMPDGKNLDVASLREFEQNVLGGMQGVLWQYSIDYPADFDATRQDPTLRFLPRRSPDNPPAAPTNLRATANANTLRDRWIQLLWDHVDEVGVSYSVYRSQTSPVPTDREHRIARGLRTRSYRDTDVDWETDYFYVVTAVDSRNGSPPSAEASARLALFHDVSATPNPFTPDGDGVDDSTTIRYRLDVPRLETQLSITAAILDSSGNVVQLLEVRPPLQRSGSHSVRWNGRRRNGTVAPPGLYTFGVSARSTRGGPPIVRLTGEVELALKPIRFSYFYSFGFSGTASVAPGETFTIWDAPWEGSPYNDIAQCQTDTSRRIRAYNHDRLSEDGPGTYGRRVRVGCSEAEEFGYVVRCCVPPRIE